MRIGTKNPARLWECVEAGGNKEGIEQKLVLAGISQTNFKSETESLLKMFSRPQNALFFIASFTVIYHISFDLIFKKY